MSNCCASPPPLRRCRQRQDLAHTPAMERHINDITAGDLYQQLLLDTIRLGVDPNASVVVETFEGYVEPTLDEAGAAMETARHAERVAQLQRTREHIIRTLRHSPTHQARPTFDRLLLETEYFTGLRDWASSSSPPASAGHRFDALASDNSANTDASVDEYHLTTTPSYIRGTLRPYQIEGVNWLLGLFSRCVNGILADEMGLGKTFQTIAFLAYLTFSARVSGPHVVVCPKSVMGNWAREFKHWCPALRVYRFHAPSAIRASLLRAHLPAGAPLRYDVVITTFEMILDEMSTFRRIGWQYLVVDEAHKLKNDESKAHAALNSLRTAHRLIITGTPLQNNLHELWALLHFLAPALFDDASSFTEWFDTVSGQQNVSVMSNLHKLLVPLMLRRRKADVSTGIPPKREIYVSCQLSTKQREWYLHVLAKDADVLNKATAASTSTLSNVLMNLRKVINHPYLMDGGEEGPPFVTDEKLVRASGKMILLDKLLHRLRSDVAGAHKVLLFSQFTSMLNIMEDYCHLRRFRYCRIDGNTSGYDRDRQMALFNAPTSDYFLFLLSTRAGGLGINLQAANHVILYDSDWNPQMDLQAQDRAHRIGQRRPVRVYRLVTDGTVEERMYRRALKKLYLDALVVRQGSLHAPGSTSVSRSSNSNSCTSREELLSMIKFGAEAVFQTRHEDVSEADLDRLLADGAERQDALSTEAAASVQMSLASFELGAEEANMYEFEGMTYRPGTESRLLHLTLPQPLSLSQSALHDMCAAYGEVIRTVLHPKLTEALVYFRTLAGAAAAKQHLPFVTRYASRHAQTIVTSEMISQCLGGGEKLGRGHRRGSTTVAGEEAPSSALGASASTSSSSAAAANVLHQRPAIALPKPPRLPAHQLYNTKRLLELHQTEVALRVARWRRRRVEEMEKARQQRERGVIGGGGGGDDDDGGVVGAAEPAMVNRRRLTSLAAFARQEAHCTESEEHVAAATDKEPMLEDFIAAFDVSEGRVRDSSGSGADTVCRAETKEDAGNAGEKAEKSGAAEANRETAVHDTLAEPTNGHRVNGDANVEEEENVKETEGADDGATNPTTATTTAMIRKDSLPECDDLTSPHEDGPVVRVEHNVQNEEEKNNNNNNKKKKEEEKEDRSAHTSHVGTHSTQGARKENEVEVEDEASHDHTSISEEDEDVLTPVERAERARLMQEGFADWSSAEYRAVVQALTCGSIDAADYEAIAAVLARAGTSLTHTHSNSDTKNNTSSEDEDEAQSTLTSAGVGKTGAVKTVTEVRRYVTALLDRGELCIPNFSRIQQRIQRAQAMVAKRREEKQAVQWKMEQYASPETQMTFRTKGDAALHREIFFAAYDSGLQSRRHIGQVIKSSPANRFNVWCQSRPEVFFGRRLCALLASVKREWEKPDEGEEEEEHDITAEEGKEEAEGGEGGGGAHHRRRKRTRQGVIL